jgi:hypothetical protein
MVLYLCVLIVFSIHRESLKLILAMNPSPRWFCHNYLIFPPLNHLEAGREWFEKVVIGLLGLPDSIKSDMWSVQIRACPSGLK